MLVVTLLEVRERDDGVVALHLPIGCLKTCSGLEPVRRCEPSTYQPNDQATAPSGPLVENI